MKQIRLIRQFSFEAAHLLPAHEGLCKHLHGHSYRLEVEVKGPVQPENSGPEAGMLLDLKRLKQWVQHAVIEPCDHALIIPGFLPIAQRQAARQLSARVLELPFTPSCENLVHWMAELLQTNLPAKVHLTRLCLWETASSAAIWLADDQA
ncbi:MAG: 6-pyruvoyl trahydropterin synthase family protein [Bacteroidia bacterium]